MLSVEESEMKPRTVKCQQPSERTRLDQCIEMVQELMPQTYSAPKSKPDPDRVCWVKMAALPMIESPLLLLGYPDGVQVWQLFENEAKEMLHRRVGRVCAACVCIPEEGRLSLVLCHGDRVVRLLDLCQGGVEVASQEVSGAVQDLTASSRFVAASLEERVCVLSSRDLSVLLEVCVCAPGCAVALGSRWLAYADNQLRPDWQSVGGLSGAAVPSITEQVIDTAAKGLGRLLVSSSSSSVVSIVDVLSCNERGLPGDEPDSRLVGHFRAHAAHPVRLLRFDATGSLLLSADAAGHQFHVFRVQVHPSDRRRSQIQHMYVLWRGETPARVLDACFSADSRLVSASTEHGTTHVFAICPYGGSATCRTHCGPRRVNKHSSFERSAGLEAPSTWSAPLPQPSTVRALCQLRDKYACALFVDNSLLLASTRGDLLQVALHMQAQPVAKTGRVAAEGPFSIDATATRLWTLKRQPDWTSVSHACTPSSVSKKTHGSWLAQLELVTHIGPSRRLWMGPQMALFTFAGAALLHPSSSALFTTESVDDLEPISCPLRPVSSPPVEMPAGQLPVTYIEVGSGHLEDSFFSLFGGSAESLRSDSDIRDTLADAMEERMSSTEDVTAEHP